MDNNERRAVVLPHSLLEALDKYAASKHISKSEAIRKFIEKGLSITSYEQSQTEIRNYIREEIETVMPIVMKRYMERLIAHAGCFNKNVCRRIAVLRFCAC